MSKSLYYCQDPCFGPFWGIKPYSEKWTEYHGLCRQVSLKDDLNWREVQQLQPVIAKSNLWKDFPASGLELVGAETKSGDEDQRLDLLYLREDGGLFPCELKTGGKSKDTHGQLIRYMADLAFQQVDISYIRALRGKIEKWDTGLGISKEKFEEFLSLNNIQDKFLRLLPRSGMIIDEGFPSQLLKAVRFLNSDCGFSIRMIELQAFVGEEWDVSQNDYLMRIDFVEVQ